MRAFPETEFWQVAPFEGNSPERLRGLPNFHTVSWENFQKHIYEDAPLVDELVKTEEDTKLAFEPNPFDLKAILERQIVGQENVIFNDLLSEKQVIQIRTQVHDMQMQSPQSMGGIINILGEEIMVPFAKYAPGQQPPTKEQVAAVVKIEQQQRKAIAENYWQKYGLKPIPYPVTQEMVEAGKQARKKQKAMAPPPPPPIANNAIIPPPPPPVFG